MGFCTSDSRHSHARRAAPRTWAPRTWAPALLAALAGIAPAAADEHDWNAGNGNWSNALNWAPNGVPGPIDSAYIGRLDGISNGTVTLDINDTTWNVIVSDGMTLRTGTKALTLGGQARATGQNVVGDKTYTSTLRIQDGPAYYDMEADDLIGAYSGQILMDGSRVRVEDLLSLQTDSVLRGRGVIEIYRDVSPALDNGAHIHNTGGTMWIFALGDGLVDLDGPDGDGTVTIDDQEGTGLSIIGESLTDAFSGILTMTSDSLLYMNLQNSWTADSGSSINVDGILGVESLPAVIYGSPVTIGGNVNVAGFGGYLQVYTDATIQPSAEFSVDFGDRVQFVEATEVQDGWFFLENGAMLDFDGPTLVKGGEFTTFGVEDADGDVDFNGPTTWDGDVTINGRAQQNGDAVVTGPTVINATLFDLSGESGTTNWDINHSLTINAESVKTHGFDFFEGQIDVGGNLLARLNVNFTGDEQAAWSMKGVMNMVGQAGDFFVTRLGGSPVLGSGVFNINYNVQVDSDLYMVFGGTLNFESADAQLRTHGKTVLREDTVFSGQGTLRNGTPGEMTLYHELSLGQVGLVNQGLLTFWRYGYPELAVLATADRFTSEDSGTLRVRIGGSDLGETYDHLLVTGAASLDGQIEVSFLQNGFVPKIGDEFTVLTAAGGINGTFLNRPVTTDGPYTYKWTVKYGANSVTLRLVDIDGCSADLAETFGVLDLFDFLAFVNYFNAGDPIADRDGNGIFDLFDFLMYVNEFNAGC